MRRPLSALAGLLLALLLGPASGLIGSPGAGAAAASSSVHLVVGGLSSPEGIALDAAGDLFIADTNRCRVEMVAAQRGTLYGLAVRAHHTYTVAGGRCSGPEAIGYPSGLAVDRHGNLYIAAATGNRILVVRHAGPRAPVVFAGTGRPGYDGNGLLATSSALDEPTGLAVDPAGDVFIADTANCRVRVVPAGDETEFGQAMTAGHLYTVAGSGVCGSAGRPGPGPSAQLWDPVAVAVDPSGDLVIADNGDQSVLEWAAHGGTYYGTAIGAGDLATVVGMGQYGPYLEEGLSATSVASELNDPEGVAVDRAGTLFITDGDMHCIRVVPATSAPLFGRSMTGGDLYTLAGAVPTNPPQGAGDGTRWELTHVDVPVGIAVSGPGAVYFSDRGADLVRVIR